MSYIAEIPREKLREIVAKTGDRILEDSERCEGLLKDHCGEHRREVSALVGALQERIPLELRSSWQNAMTPEAMRARLVQRLQDNRGLAPEVADWAVDAWSYALGVGLGRSSDRLDSRVVSAPPLPPVPGGPSTGNQWVGSQVFMPPQGQTNSGGMPYIPPPPPAPLLMTDPIHQKKNSGMKAIVGIAVVALAGYLLGPQLMNSLNPKEVEKPCVKRDAKGVCLDGQQQQTSVTPTPTPGPGPTPTPTPVPKPPPIAAILPVGTPLSVRIGEGLSSQTATAGQYINATLTAPLMNGTSQVLPTGARVVLQVTDVDSAGRLIGVPQIKLAVYQVEIGGRNYLAGSTPFVAKGPSRTVNTVKKGGIGAAIGCGAGAVVGVFTRSKKKGCGVGAAGGAGAGTVVAATDEIKPAVIGAGTVIRFSLVRPLTLG